MILLQQVTSRQVLTNSIYIARLNFEKSRQLPFFCLISKDVTFEVYKYSLDLYGFET
jgi:hypothetical protein